MKNEINRPGDKPQFDERANEDSYFALKERELVEDLRFEFHKAAAAEREARLATCPKCSGRFANYPFLGFDLERCERCEGIWLNKGELAAILRQQARGPLAIFLDRCFAKDKRQKKI